MAITMGYGLWAMGYEPYSLPTFSSLHVRACCGPRFHANNGDDAEPHIGLCLAYMFASKDLPPPNAPAAFPAQLAKPSTP
jgi:hypothetical protein